MTATEKIKAVQMMGYVHGEIRKIIGKATDETERLATIAVIEAMAGELQRVSRDRDEADGLRVAMVGRLEELYCTVFRDDYGQEWPKERNDPDTGWNKA